MIVRRKLAARDLALVVTFTALYVVFGFLKLSPIIGLPGQAITAAALMAPLMGIILGQYMGTLSAFLGGVIGFFFGSFSQPSFASGVVAALCSGLSYKGRRVAAAVVYVSLLFLLAFYPSIGPAWLYPTSLWFQLIGLIILISPLHSVAVKNLSFANNSKLLYSFFIVSLTSTLAGQIAGNLTFELIRIPDVNYFKGTWETITILYPVERTTIALGTAFAGAALYRVLRATNFMPILNRAREQ